MERICSQGSKFFPFRVDPFSAKHILTELPPHPWKYIPLYMIVGTILTELPPPNVYTFPLRNNIPLKGPGQNNFDKVASPWKGIPLP